MIVSVPVVADEDPFIMTLNQKYNNTVEMIFNECTADAEYVKSVAERRDVGELQKSVINQMFVNITHPGNKVTGGTPTTANVLAQAILIAMIFNNPDLTAEEIYLQQFKYCTDDSIQFLTLLYENQKAIYKLQKETTK